MPSTQFTVIVLVASIPIAIEIVVTTTLALGSRQLASHGAIVTRLAAIEEMAGMNMLCSDKTGERGGAPPRHRSPLVAPTLGFWGRYSFRVKLP